MSVDTATLVRLAVTWRDADPDPATRAQIDAALQRSDPAELAELFGDELHFGTAGLRAPLGPGPNRMNRLVVRRTAVALAQHLHDLVGAVRRPVVVVGRDARHGSADFDAEAVEVLAGLGVDVEHFDDAVPTPLVAFAVRQRNADAGIVVTASHNPATDNGVKVYAADGAQIIPPADVDIARRLRAAPIGPAPTATVSGRVLALVAPTSVAAAAHGDEGEVVAAYLQHAASLVPQVLAAPLRVAHTSLHGVGDALLGRALGLADGVEVHPVADQRRPDPDFPGLASPNPEEPGALDAVLDLARRVGADVGLAVDPDADRLAVALPVAGDDWRVLSGDELGALLAAHLISTTDGPDRLVASTVVSSRLVPAICQEAGVRHVETLTGFKWLCRPGLAHPEWRQLLLYEEALGYAVGPSTRDKDGITAALVTLDAIARWRSAGRSAWDVLDELERRHGAHVTRNGSVRARSSERGADAALARLTARRAPEMGGLAVLGEDRPAPDVQRWQLAEGTRVLVRPSGTEPKVKYYVEAIEPVQHSDSGDAALAAARDVAATRADRVVADLLDALSG